MMKFFWKKRVKILGLSLVIVAHSLVVQPCRAEQKCNSAIQANNPDSSFILQENGTVIQPSTALVWMRCALGQRWDGKSCVDKAVRMTWAEALRQADISDFAGYTDWRLPNKNELESIVEQRCALPAVSLSVFPASPADFFWTSSPYVGLSNGAWSVDFAFGVVTASEKKGTIYVRLVRDEQ